GSRARRVRAFPSRSPSGEARLPFLDPGQYGLARVLGPDDERLSDRFRFEIGLDGALRCPVEVLLDQRHGPGWKRCKPVGEVLDDRVDLVVVAQAIEQAEGEGL